MPRYANPDRDAAAERKLMALQRRIAAVHGLLAERDAMLCAMSDLDYSHRQLTELLNRANDKVGARHVTVDAVQKAIKKRRAA